MAASLITKIFATALTLSQINTQPDNIKTNFNPSADQEEVTKILNAGCTFLMKDFGFDSKEMDGLFKALLMKAQTAQVSVQLKKGLDLESVQAGFSKFCLGQEVPDLEKKGIVLKDIIEFYNDALKELPDHMKAVNDKLSNSTSILDGNGERFTEFYRDENRRRFKPISEIPKHVQLAFVSAEDQRFFDHGGVDTIGAIRAFQSDTGEGASRPQGGSTITQQLIKNRLVGDDVTFERKIREMVLATRLESDLAKQLGSKAAAKSRILELYLNFVFLGRASWGVEMASQSYFRRPTEKLSPAEAAFLAGLTKGPYYYNPDRYAERSKFRTLYVLKRMKDDQFLAEDQHKAAFATVPVKIEANPESPKSRKALYFVDQIVKSAKRLTGKDAIDDAHYTIQSTIHRPLQQVVESSLQEGLVQYEIAFGRAEWGGAELNLYQKMMRLYRDPTRDQSIPLWQEALQMTRAPLYDVAWPLAVVTRRDRDGIEVGLKNGNTYQLRAWDARVLGSIRLWDVVHVRIVRNKNDSSNTVYASLRFRPSVEGSAVVLENRTGKILAMSGGFSYPLSQLNRAMTKRQPGSTVKPLTYLAALSLGYQPNQLISTNSSYFQPVVNGPGARAWSPNGDNEGIGNLTLRHALEISNNYATANALKMIGQSQRPVSALDLVRRLAKANGVWDEPLRYYPIILGAQETSIISLATFYATIANGGYRPTPHTVTSVMNGNQTVYARTETPLVQVQEADDVSYLQLRSMLQGVLERGTAHSLAEFAPYVAGKTGTSNEALDAWFAGFTNDITIAVWVGYDNDDRHSRRTLGNKASAAQVAIPIFEKILRGSYAETNGQPVYKRLEPLRAPHPQLAAKVTAYRTERRQNARQGGSVDYFRNGSTQPTDYTTDDSYQYRQDDPYTSRRSDEYRPTDDQSPRYIPRDPRYNPGPIEDRRDMYRRRRFDPDLDVNGWPGNHSGGG